MSTKSEIQNNTQILSQSQKFNSTTYRGFEAVIGIEVHVQLKTHSKIFSSDATHFEASDNENTSPVSVGMPGTLPVLNKKAVEYAIKTGLALQSEINRKSIFARKNYFYPDLPKGYQISQYDQPICIGGFIEFKINGELKKVGITRAHLEEDAGKSTHFGQFTLLNYNRAGVPLLEIVSEPEMHTPQEAAEYCRTLRSIVRAIDVCDGNLEEGSLRCDCNVSVRRVGETKLGTKVELKNINSFRFVEKAIEYEIHRQIDAIENNEKIVQETRLYDSDKNRTYTMRTKEDAQDYRYFPDPDLLPLVISEEDINFYKTSLIELPFYRSQRFQNELGLSESDSIILTEEKSIADYFEKCGLLSKNYKASANWIISELIRELNDHHLTMDQSKISAERLAQLIQKIDEGVISGKIAKTIFKKLWETEASVDEIIKSENLVQQSDPEVLRQVVIEVLKKSPSQVSEYKAGKEKMLGFFVGQIMKATKGQGNPALVNQILLEELAK